MNILNTAVRTAIKRPFIIIFFALLMLACAFLNSVNPLIPIVAGLINITGTSLYESIVSALQVIFEPSFIPGFLLVLLGLALVASLLAGALFSGLFQVLANTLGGNEKRPKEFIQGLKKFFLKIFLMTLRAFLFAEFLTIFLMVVCVPAVVVTRAAFTDKPNLMLAAVFVDLLTVMVLFFGLMFSRAYIYFWYPAVIQGEKRPFSAGKKHVNQKFWGIIGRLFVFDITFALFQVFISMLGDATAKLIVGWVFNTIFFISLITFVFDSYQNDKGPKSENQAS
jgi:MFS family permease